MLHAAHLQKAIEDYIHSDGERYSINEITEELSKFMKVGLAVRFLLITRTKRILRCSKLLRREHTQASG
jgi:hypothetical protein